MPSNHNYNDVKNEQNQDHLLNHQWFFPCMFQRGDQFFLTAELLKT